MHYQTAARITTLQAPGAAPSTHIHPKAHHAERKQRSSCLLRAGRGWGRAGSQQVGTAGEGRSRGHLKSTTVQDAEAG